MTDRYSPGERVFAKMKGYQPWPSRVKERLPVRTETYRIYFYGTYEEANIKVDQIFPYNEDNVAKYGKALKKPRFKEAMQEMADDLLIHDKGAEPEPMAVLPQEFETADQEDSDGSEGELLIDEGPMTPIPAPRRDSKPPTLTPAPQMPKMTPAPPRMTPCPVQKGTPGGATPRGSLSKVTPIPPLKQAPIVAAKLPEPVEVTPPVKQTRRGSKGISKKDLAFAAAVAGSATPPPTPVVDTTPQPEIVSRSGRKIKPKRFADDELPVSAAAAAKGTSGDEGKGSEGPPPTKRTRRRASQGVVPVVPVTKTAAKQAEAPVTPTPPVAVPPVPTLIQKPKLTPAIPTPTPTRGRTTRLSSSEATISVTPVVAPPPVPTLRARPGAVLPTPPQKRRSTSTHVFEKSLTVTPIAVKPTKVSKTPIVREPEDAEEEQPDTELETNPRTPEFEEVLGLITPNEDDVEDKENNDLSAEEDQWLENGEEEEPETESGEDDGGALDEDVVEDEEGEEPEDPLDISPVRKLPIMAKNGVDVELTYDEDRPEEFETESARVEWDLATARNVLKIRTALEKDEFASTNFLAEVARAVESKEEELKALVSIKTKEKVMRKIQQLRVEGEMIEIVGEIVGCLGEQKEHDLDRALEFLERLSTHELNTLLLKKHPELPQTISKLRRFVGDPDRLNYNAAQREDLKVKAGLIRAKACAIYMNLKTLFCLNPDQPFMSTYKEEVAKFNEAVAHLSEKSVLSLVVDPTEKIEKNKKEDKVAEIESEPKVTSTTDIEKEKTSPSENEQETNTETEASVSASESDENKNADASPSPGAVTGETETETTETTDPDEKEHKEEQTGGQTQDPPSPMQVEAICENE